MSLRANAEDALQALVSLLCYHPPNHLHHQPPPPPTLVLSSPGGLEKEPPLSRLLSTKVKVIRERRCSMYTPSASPRRVLWFCLRRPGVYVIKDDISRWPDESSATHLSLFGLCPAWKHLDSSVRSTRLSMPGVTEGPPTCEILFRKDSTRLCG